MSTKNIEIFTGDIITITSIDPSDAVAYYGQGYVFIAYAGIAACLMVAAPFLLMTMPFFAARYVIDTFIAFVLGLSGDLNKYFMLLWPVTLTWLRYNYWGIE